ncbi:MAG: hypothetical protein KDD36_07740 [Flavobacteriales bacterium]|nr:hypothetical protein [Flavobacteriales bacterium]
MLRICQSCCLHCCITDNGVGFPKYTNGDGQRTRSSLGMNIVNERAKAFGRKYGSQIKVDASDVLTESGEVAGAKVILQIPLIDSV